MTHTYALLVSPMHHCSLPKTTIVDIPRPVLPEEESPNAFRSRAPAVVVACWWGLVEQMDRRTLDRFTRDIWKRFDPKDLEPLKWAIPSGLRFRSQLM